MKTLLVLLIVLCHWSAAAAVVHPPRFPRVQPIPAMDALLRGQVRHILREGFPPEIPNEGEEPIRSRAGAVFAAAACLKFSDCESPEQVRRLVLDLLRDLTRAHLTGGGVTRSGKPWGDHWQSALWAYEAAFGGWLLWGDLPEETRDAVARMVIHEADRYLDLSPPYAEFLDTKAEENSWNSLILIFASELMPDHPHAVKWRERGLEYTVSSVATRADLKSAAKLAGRPVRSWIQGANVHDDFTMENHGFVHPDYMTTISQNLTHALVYRLSGRPMPEALLHNAQPSYDILKVFTQRDCSLFYPNGTDWNLHHLDHAWNVHILAERVIRDPDAGALAACALDTLGKMQSRGTSGRLYVPGEYSTYSTVEQHSAFLVASGLIAAKLWPPVAKARPLDAVWKSLYGVKVYPDGRLFLSRTRDSITSFAWGLRVMGQTVPFTFDPIVNPLNRSYVGIAGEIPPAGDVPGRLGITSAAFDRAIASDPLVLSTAIVSQENGAVSLTATARHGTLRRQFSFTALPDGNSVYMERFDGQGSPPHGGLISLLEDPRWVHGVGERSLERGEGWLNVDNRLGFIIAGAASPPLERRDLRTRAIFLNPSPRRGNTVVMVTLPSSTVAETRAAASGLRRLETGHPLVTAVRTGESLVVTNFDGAGHANAITVKLRFNGREIAVPANGGATRILRNPE